MNKLSDKCYSKYKDAYINALKVFLNEKILRLLIL